MEHSLAISLLCICHTQGCKISNFQSELNILEKTISDCIVDGEVLIIGDMNCHFGEEYGIRGSGESYGNSRCLMRMVAGYNMQMADIGEKGIGPKYSFYSALHKTYLDHCAVSEDLYNIVDRCEIIPDDIDNVSDHLAIRVVINVAQSQVRSSEARHQVGWDKATPDAIMQFYTLPHEAEMNKLLDEYDINRAMILEDQTLGKLQNVWDLRRIVDQWKRKMLERLGCSLEGQVIQTTCYTDNTRKLNEALGVNKCTVFILMRSNAWKT